MNIKPDLLLKDELEFELACRGICGVNTCLSMRKILKEILSQESQGKLEKSIKYPQFCIDNLQKELTTCEEKARNLLMSWQVMAESPDKGIIRRLEARSIHLENRINLLAQQDASLVDNIGKIREDLLKLKYSFDSVKEVDIDGVEEISDSLKEILQKSLGDAAFAVIQNLESNTESKNVKLPDDQPSTSRVMKNPFDDLEKTDYVAFDNTCFRRNNLVRSSTIDQDGGRRKLIPIKDWGIKFTGKNNFSINAFLERVHELKDARNANDEDLYRYAIDFFEDEALIWFRANKDSVTNWSELVNLLLLTFQSPFYQDELLDEIKRRTQGKQERIMIYLAIMQNMFNRLPIKILEMQKLAILQKNIQPYYQQAICRESFNSVAELTRILRIIEQTKINCENFKEPMASNMNLEPDLAIQSNNTSSTVSFQNEIAAADIKNIEGQKCWNCRNVGHRFNDCPYPKQRIFCYKCGNFGQTFKSCNTCNPQQGNESQGVKPAI